MNTFENALREIIQDKRANSIPILFITQIIIILEDNGLLKGENE